MHKTKLPLTINVSRLVQQGAVLCGKLPLAAMSRLAPLLLNAKGEINVDLHFIIDAEGMRKITGSVKTQLTLACQRCLQPLQYTIDDELRLGVINSDYQAKTLSPTYEPLLVVDGQQDLAAMVEDELIVRLPVAAMHDTNTCRY